EKWYRPTLKKFSATSCLIEFIVYNFQIVAVTTSFRQTLLDLRGDLSMPEQKRKVADKKQTDLRMDGFEKFFDDGQASGSSQTATATVSGEATPVQGENLVARFTELVALTVDQRLEMAKIANQLIENQRQLIATQQILIRLMERSIELTRHITGIEERLPAVFELPKMVEGLKVKVAELEGIELS